MVLTAPIRSALPWTAGFQLFFSIIGFARLHDRTIFNILGDNNFVLNKFDTALVPRVAVHWTKWLAEKSPRSVYLVFIVPHKYKTTGTKWSSKMVNL